MRMRKDVLTTALECSINIDRVWCQTFLSVDTKVEFESLILASITPHKSCLLCFLYHPYIFNLKNFSFTSTLYIYKLCRTPFHLMFVTFIS